MSIASVISRLDVLGRGDSEAPMLSIEDLARLGRRRGRPRGKGRKDEALLAKVADLLLRRPRMRPYTAIRSVIPKNRLHQRDSIARRLKRAWDERHKVLLAEARQRRDAEMMRRDFEHAKQLEDAMGGAAVVQAMREATLLTSTERMERDALGPTAYALIEQGRSVTRNLDQYRAAERMIAQTKRDALGPDYDRPLRATDMLYGSPRRPRYATDVIMDRALRAMQDMEDAVRRANGLWPR
jgi:hypothetical protein